MTAEEEQEVDRAWRLAFGDWKPAPPPPPEPQTQPKPNRWWNAKPTQTFLRWWNAMVLLAVFVACAYTFFYEPPTKEEKAAAALEMLAGQDCDKLPTTMGVLFCRWDAHKLTHLLKP